jgi:hypothetical protein
MSQPTVTITESRYDELKAELLRLAVLRESTEPKARLSDLHCDCLSQILKTFQHGICGGDFRMMLTSAVLSMKRQRTLRY